MRIRRSILILVLFFGVLVPETSHNPVSAQSSTENSDIDKDEFETQSTKTEQQFADLLSQINQNVTILERYEKKFSGAGEEDRIVLKLQLHRLRIQILEEVQQLADLFLELNDSAPQPDRLSEIESIFSRVTSQLWLQIDQLRNEIDILRAKRPDADTGDRVIIENQIEKLTEYLDQYFEQNLTHIQKMEQVGLDTRDARGRFTSLLLDRIDELSGRLELALIRFDEYEAQLKSTPGDADIIKKLNAAKISLDTNKKSMNTVLELMDAVDLDASAYRTQLLTETRDISSGMLDTDVAFRLLSRSYKNTVDWFAKNGPGYVLKLLLFIAIIFIFIFIARIVRMGLDKTLSSSNLNLSTLSHRMIVSTSSKLIILFGILIALSQWGISLGPLLAGLGIAGFIVGFALQDTLGNFASGLMILLYRPYDVDDLIDVGGIFGRVEKMSLVSTSLLTLDNQLFVVPNSKIWGDVIKNVTAQENRRIDMVFGVSYSDNIPKAESILKDIVESHELVLDTPEPVIRLHTLGESSVDFIVRPWVKVKDYWEVYWDITRSVKLRFDEEGISIPFPQRDIHIYNHDSDKKEE